MSVSTRITFLFTSLVLGILSLVCGSVYYFSYTNRVSNIRTRLGNWAITTGRLLSQSKTFDQRMVLQIDAATVLAMRDKSVQAYNLQNQIKYFYSDDTASETMIDPAILKQAATGENEYFHAGSRDGIALLYKDGSTHLLMVALANDLEGKKKLTQLGYILLLSLAGGILISFAAGYIFSKQLLLPIKKIADDVNEISVQNLARRIKAGNGNDEWNYLAGTLNELLNRLKESFEIHRRFIANASHELTTPLTAITSQLEISLHRDREAAEYRKVMESVYQDARKLNRLTQTLLEFARASGDPGGIEIDLIRVDEIILSLPGEIGKLNKSYTVYLEFDRLPEEAERLLVFGNEDLLFSALKNIALNACKYSENHSAWVKLSLTDNQIKIAIRDEGRGIDQSEIQKIFQPFYRTEEGNVGVEGFGLGLALARQIIKLHKGQIDIQSTPGIGTCAIIELTGAGNLSRLQTT